MTDHSSGVDHCCSHAVARTRPGLAEVQDTLFGDAIPPKGASACHDGWAPEVFARVWIRIRFRIRVHWSVAIASINDVFGAGLHAAEPNLTVW